MTAPTPDEAAHNDAQARDRATEEFDKTVPLVNGQAFRAAWKLREAGRTFGQAAQGTQGTHTREDVIASYNAGYVAAVEKHVPGLAAIDPDKLDALADWFDQDDAKRGGGRGSEVQADLRCWAEIIRTARQP